MDFKQETEIIVANKQTGFSSLLHQKKQQKVSTAKI